jgi:hypothetical protein
VCVIAHHRAEVHRKRYQYVVHFSFLSREKHPFPLVQNYFQGVKIYFQGLVIYFQGLVINFQSLKIVL